MHEFSTSSLHVKVGLNLNQCRLMQNAIHIQFKTFHDLGIDFLILSYCLQIKDYSFGYKCVMHNFERT